MYTLKQIEQTLLNKGYLVYNQPNKLNVVGIRTKSNTSSKTFDDYIAYFYYDDKGRMIGKVAPATTDPSVYYLRDNPMVARGTAILKSGQYKDAYVIGTHADKYTALVQRGAPVTVIRDNDRNDLLNFFADTDTGYFGINIHRASRGKNNANIIGPDSAGCQVFRDEADFNEMMRLAQVSKSKYGNKFTYTLLDEMDDIKVKRNVGLLLAGVGLVGFGIYYYLKIRKK
jgi:hypothetical protein